MRLINPSRRIAELEKENALLRAENERLIANQDYIAMMTDIEIDDEGDETDES